MPNWAWIVTIAGVVWLAWRAKRGSNETVVAAETVQSTAGATRSSDPRASGSQLSSLLLKGAEIKAEATRKVAAAKAMAIQPSRPASPAAAQTSLRSVSYGPATVAGLRQMVQGQAGSKNASTSTWSLTGK